MDKELLELLELIIEYMNNTNAAGEYDGNDPRLKDCLAEDKILNLARKVQQRPSHLQLDKMINKKLILTNLKLWRYSMTEFDEDEMDYLASLVEANISQL